MRRLLPCGSTFLSREITPKDLLPRCESGDSEPWELAQRGGEVGDLCWGQCGRPRWRRPADRLQQAELAEASYVVGAVALEQRAQVPLECLGREAEREQAAQARRRASRGWGGEREPTVTCVDAQAPRWLTSVKRFNDCAITQAAVPMSEHNAPVAIHSRASSRAWWLNALIVGSCTLALWAGAVRLTVDNVAFVLAYLGLVLAIAVALVLHLNRGDGGRASGFNGLIVGVGCLLMSSAGVGRLDVVVDEFAFVQACRCLVLVIMIALLLHVRRSMGAPPS